MSEDTPRFKWYDKLIMMAITAFTASKVMPLIAPNTSEAYMLPPKPAPAENALHLTPEMVRKLSSDTNRTYIGPATEVKLTDSAEVNKKGEGLLRSSN